MKKLAILMSLVLIASFAWAGSWKGYAAKRPPIRSRESLRVEAPTAANYQMDGTVFHWGCADNNPWALQQTIHMLRLDAAKRCSTQIAF